MSRFVVSTQFLENYGAHAGSGRFADGEACWKMKGGTDYLVEGLDRIQDAVAFVAALCDNTVGAKEFPVEWRSYHDWVMELPEDDEDRERMYDQLFYVDPKELV